MATKINTSIQVAFLKEDGTYIAYCPALDLSAYGDSMEDAWNSFDVTYRMFIDDLVKKGNLVDVLLDLGWTIKRSPQPVFKSPYFRSWDDIKSKLPGGDPHDYSTVKTKHKRVSIPV